MKIQIRSKLLLLPVLLAIPMASCTVSDYPSHRSFSSAGTRTVYTTFPRDYVGDAYYYNKRYYTGGRYETGRFNFHGRLYTERYVHGGRYLYGGTYRPHRESKSYQDHADHHGRRNDHDDGNSLRRSNRSSYQSRHVNRYRR